MSEHTADPEELQAPFRDRLLDWLDELRFAIYATLLVVLLLVGFLWQSVFVTVPAGHHAVLFNRFWGGTNVKRVYGEGLHLMWPWSTLVPYESRLQVRTLSMQVLSQEGLGLDITVTVLFTPIVRNLGYLHRDLGPDFFDRLVKPSIIGHLRHTFGGRPAHEIYSSAREALQEISRVPLMARQADSSKGSGEPLTEPYLRLEELRLTEITLPPALVTSINQKQQAEQRMLEYQYRLQEAEKEAERMRAEAAGIRDFNLIASKLSPDVLRWRGLQATLELAKSNNAKIIVMGGGQVGLPVNLNLIEQPAVTPAAPPAAAAKAPKAPRTPARRTATDAAEPAAAPPAAP